MQLVEINLWEEGRQRAAFLSISHLVSKKRNQSSRVKRLAECRIYTYRRVFLILRRRFVALPVGEGSAPVWLIQQKSPRDGKHKQIIKMFIYVVAERWGAIDQTFGSNGPSFCQWFTSSKILWKWGTQTASLWFLPEHKQTRISAVARLAMPLKREKLWVVAISICPKCRRCESKSTQGK